MINPVLHDFTEHVVGSSLVADRIKSPESYHELYEAMRHCLATLHGTTENEMSATLMFHACDIADRAYRTACDRHYDRCHAPGVVAWGTDGPGYSVIYRRAKPEGSLPSPNGDPKAISSNFHGASAARRTSSGSLDTALETSGRPVSRMTSG